MPFSVYLFVACLRLNPARSFCMYRWTSISHVRFNSLFGLSRGPLMDPIFLHPKTRQNHWIPASCDHFGKFSRLQRPARALSRRPLMLSLCLATPTFTRGRVNPCLMLYPLSVSDRDIPWHDCVWQFTIFKQFSKKFLPLKSAATSCWHPHLGYNKALKR